MQGIANAKDPVSYVQQAYMSLAETAPVMGTVTLGMTAPLSDRYAVTINRVCLTDDCSFQGALQPLHPDGVHVKAPRHRLEDIF